MGQIRSSVIDVIKKSKLEYTINKGEELFGPKLNLFLEIPLEIGNITGWFKLTWKTWSFIANDGTKKVPVMLHGHYLDP